MKKKIITLMAAFVLFANILLANTNKNGIPESVASEFNRDFSNAKEVRWEGLGIYYKATFEQDDNTLYVFYTDNAEFMGIAKNVLSDKLPESLKANIKSRYPDYWISELVKYVVVDKTGFFVTIENVSEKIVLKTDDNLHWQVFTKKMKA